MIARTSILTTERIAVARSPLCCILFIVAVTRLDFWEIWRMPLKQKTIGQHSLKTAASAFSYRLPIPVVQVRLYRDDCYPVCPRCHNSFDREYTQFCDRCGQRLSWELFQFATIQKIGKEWNEPLQSCSGLFYKRAGFCEGFMTHRSILTVKESSVAESCNSPSYFLTIECKE